MMRSTEKTLPPPPAFGLPDKFSSWRPHQEDAIQAVLDADCRFIVQVQPTGSGKSLTYMATALLSGVRALILTSTKGLQDQIMADFGGGDVCDVRGQNAYRCRVGLVGRDGDPAQVACDNGPCHVGYGCQHKDSGCHYHDAVRAAKRAQIVVTNYAYWLTAGRRGESPLGEFDLLVLDEAHDAPEWVLSALAVRILKQDIQTLAGTVPEPPATDRVHEWRLWSRAAASGLARKIDDLKSWARTSGERWAIREAVRLGVLEADLGTLLHMTEGNWVVDSVQDAFIFDPIWPADHAHTWLFKKIPQVVMTSATVRAKTAEMLGLKPGDYILAEYPSTFPMASRPVIHVPTARVDHRWQEHDRRQWLRRIDQIIDRRRDRKGIIHTVSYDRRNLVLASSEHKDCMFTHDRRNLRAAISNFKSARPPAVLVSPSVVTGWDFPYSECEYIVVAKVPFPDSRSKIMKARAKRDRDHGAMLAAQALAQSAGRGMRAADDRCEVLVIDDHWQWYIGKYGALFPQWFREGCRMSRTIPQPLPKIGKVG